jgi:hypothetical protein
MENIGKIIVYSLFVVLIVFAAYAALKGLMKGDVEREDKWAEYDGQNRKDKR